MRSGASSESSSMATIPLRSMVFVECSAFVSFVVLLLPDGVTEMPWNKNKLHLKLEPITWKCE